MEVVVGLPHFFLHPAVYGAVGNAGGGVEGVEDLVAHAPARVGTIHEDDNAGAVALIGVVIDGDGGAVFVEGDFLWVAQAGVDDFEV